VAGDINCWDACASISRVKHVLDGQDMGDLMPNDPLWIIIYRLFQADDGTTIRTLASFQRPVFPPALTFGLNQPIRGDVDDATLQTVLCTRFWWAPPIQNLIKEIIVQALDAHVVSRATVR